MFRFWIYDLRFTISKFTHVRVRFRHWKIKERKSMQTFSSHGVANESSPRRQPWERLSNKSSRVAAKENIGVIFLSLLPELFPL